ncbi:MAG: OB-fold domain-containing protein [Limnohabitans sp.]|nr:OB-fold domain-containing protein [Limnohabitans sp.]
MSPVYRFVEWREASGRGTLVAATLTHFHAPGFKDKLPYLQGLVRLEEGPRIFANLTGATLPQLVPGKAMRLVFGAEPGGPFLFEPAA